MKAFCSKDALLIGVNTVQKAVSNKSTQPVLQGILVKTSDQSLIFEATDTEIGIRCIIPAQVEEDGVVVLPSRIFSDMVRKLPDTQIELVEENDGIIHLNYYESTVILKGFDPEEFPLLPDLYDATTFNIPVPIFKTMIRQTVFACSNEESRPVFTGALLQIEGENIRLIGTDTHRLAYRKEIIANEENYKFNGIIPAKSLTEIYRLLKEDEEELEIRFSQSQVLFKFGAVTVISRMIEGQYPNYKQVIPQTCQTKVYLSAKQFQDSVERASLLSRDPSQSNIIRFLIEPDYLRIDQSSEMGKISEQIAIRMEGSEMKIAFNSKFLLDVLKVIDSEEILIEFSGSYSPGIIRLTDDSNYLYLVLPVRAF